MEYLLLWMCVGLMAAFLAKFRGRFGWKWFILLILMGPLGFVIAFLPKETKKG